MIEQGNRGKMRIEEPSNFIVDSGIPFSVTSELE